MNPWGSKKIGSYPARLPLLARPWTSRDAIPTLSHFDLVLHLVAVVWTRTMHSETDAFVMKMVEDPGRHYQRTRHAGHDSGDMTRRTMKMKSDERQRLLL